MCTTIRYCTHIANPWDPGANAITVPAGLSAERTLLAVRAVLTELGVDQPPETAVCWCGEPVIVEASAEHQEVNCGA